MGRVCATLWKNQQGLDQAHHKLDTQQFVLARLVIPMLNYILIRADSDDLISEESIGRVFLEWDEFKKRSDYKERLVEWMTGVPLSDLPEPPKVEEQEPEEAPVIDDEGPREFGGDYAERQASSSRDEADTEEHPEGESSVEADEVP